MIMTSISFCEKCNSFRFSFEKKSNETEKQGEMGVKSSCCGKCSNINCVDYGECICFEKQMELRQEYITKMIRDGTFPYLNKE